MEESALQMRSQHMQLVQLFVQTEAAFETVNELGRLGSVEFRDLNPGLNAFQRPYVNEVRRCDELERKLRFFRTELDKGGFKIPEKPPPMQLIQSTKLEHIEAEIDELDTSLRELNKNRDLLYREFYQALELQHVLHKDSIMLDQHETTAMTDELLESERQSRVQTIPGSGSSSRTGSGGLATPLLSNDVEAQRGQEMETRSGVNNTSRLGFVTGVILREKLRSFQRILFRATHGNMFLRDMEIGECVIDPHTLEDVDKNVFIVFFAGERAGAKVKKICESFGANLYDHPKDASELRERISTVTSSLEDLRTVIWRTVDMRKATLARVAKEYSLWHSKVITEKAAYHILNQFNYDASHKCLIAEAWCPVTATHDVEQALARATNTSGAQVQSILRVMTTEEKPPTYFYTNKFTKGFQAIVDAYGMAGYREINPTPFTIITFPFLFAVMFGDVGHGAIMLMFALFLLTREKTWKKKNINEMLWMTFQGRYLILLMGAFSLFTGLMYNETFSVTLDIFGTAWSYDTTKCHTIISSEAGAACMPDRNSAYPFGMDPIWRTTTNELLYTNSLKMKLSVILGVSQMIFGIVLSFFNAWSKRDMRSLYCEVIPQIVFMSCTFGYLVIIIFIKWYINWDDKQSLAPSLITTLINFFMSPGTVENPLFSGQAVLQVVFVLLAVLSVPIMLFPKPFLIRAEHRRKMAGGSFSPLALAEEGDGPAASSGAPKEDEFDFMEVMVIQIIHTIEFVLGAVSNTASYLRLWALSLAHAELSTVFWDLILATTANSGKFYMMFVGFAIWFSATMVVLMAMESLSAFLHALRLHWVEFQNKFYHGDGYQFIPFSFEHVLLGSGDDE